MSKSKCCGEAALVGALTTFFIVCTPSYGADFAGVAKLHGGLDLQVLDRSASCNGGPGAFVFRDGQKIDQTCNVKITKKGVSALFPGYGRPVFFPNGQFTAVTPQP